MAFPREKSEKVVAVGWRAVAEVGETHLSESKKKQEKAHQT